MARATPPDRAALVESITLSTILVGGVALGPLALAEANIYVAHLSATLLAPGLVLVRALDLDPRQTLVATVLANVLVYSVPLHALRIALARRIGPGADRIARGLRAILVLAVAGLLPLAGWLSAESRAGSASTGRVASALDALGERFPPPPRLDARTSEIERLIREATNAARAARDLGPLRHDEALDAIARAHSLDMIESGFFAHENPRGEDPTARARRHGYPVEKQLAFGVTLVGIAENIGISGAGVVPRSLDEVASELLDGWMASDAHRDNILHERFDRIGVGVAFDGFRYTATQNFR